VEGKIQSAAQANIEFFIYLASALLFLGTVILISVRPFSWHRWLAGLAVGIAWLITWYAPISIWIGALLELLVLWVVISMPRRVSRQKTG
jgi:hypothetical protein